MKAILMSIRPQYVAKILNGEKTIEIRKKFPSDYVGWVYIYCTKDEKIFLRDFRDKKKWAAYWKFVAMGNDPSNVGELPPILNGKVIFKFRCYKVEEILPFEEYESPFGMAYKLTKDKIVCCQKAQLTYDEYNHYLKGKKGCAIHISDLEIFDKPKEISEFMKKLDNFDGINCWRCSNRHNCSFNSDKKCEKLKLTRAPQSWCWIED